MESSFPEQAGCAEAGGPTARGPVMLQSQVVSGLFLEHIHLSRALPSVHSRMAMCTTQHACCSWSVLWVEALSENGKPLSSLTTGETDRPARPGPWFRNMSPKARRHVGDQLDQLLTKCIHPLPLRSLHAATSPKPCFSIPEH